VLDDPTQRLVFAWLAQTSLGRRIGTAPFDINRSAGWNQDEMENHGTVYATRFKRMRESIEAMKEVWTKAEAKYQGEFVNFDPMIARPNPCRNRIRRSILAVLSPMALAAQFATARWLDSNRPWRNNRTAAEIREMAKEASCDPASVTTFRNGFALFDRREGHAGDVGRSVCPQVMQEPVKALLILDRLIPLPEFASHWSRSFTAHSSVVDFTVLSIRTRDKRPPSWIVLLRVLGHFVRDPIAGHGPLPNLKIWTDKTRHPTRHAPAHP
jgi:hypothetical protein